MSDSDSSDAAPPPPKGRRGPPPPKGRGPPPRKGPPPKRGAPPKRGPPPPKAPASSESDDSDERPKRGPPPGRGRPPPPKKQQSDSSDEEEAPKPPPRGRPPRGGPPPKRGPPPPKDSESEDDALAHSADEGARTGSEGNEPDSDDVGERRKDSGSRPTSRAGKRRGMGRGNRKEIVVDDESPPPKPKVQGRRGRRQVESSEEERSDSPPPRAAKKPQGRRQARAQKKKDKYENDTIVDLDKLQSMDEVQDAAGDLTSVVADAPNVRQHQVQSLRELDSAILFQLPSATQEGVDLSFLTNVLAPQDMVAESDIPWDFDALFTEVSSAVQAELEALEAEDGETPVHINT